MKKLIAGAVAAALGLAGCASGPKSGDIPSALTFELYNEVFAYGQDTTRVIIDAGIPVRGNSVDLETFRVSARNTLPEGFPANPANPDFPIAWQGERLIARIWTSNDGETFTASAQGRYIVLELAHGRTMTTIAMGDSTMDVAADTNGAGTLYYDFMGTQSNILLNLNYEVVQEKPFILESGNRVSGLPLTKSEKLRSNEVIPGEINPLVNLFVPGRYNPPGADNSGEYLEYSLYVPENAGGSLPLVVWLHGMGEGRNGYGIQNQNVLRANEEGTAWVKPENQAARPAFVLVPQSPNIGWTSNNGTTYVKAVIDELLAAYPNIDPRRIYVCGDSMGGFGTYAILLQFPGFFAAAITAPGGADFNDINAVFSADQLGRIGRTPVWCVSVEGDMVMPVQQRTAFNSLKAGGANVRWTNYPSQDVVEVYGQAHWSWVPLLRNMPRTDDSFMYDGSTYRAYAGDPPGQTIMDWLFAQRKP
jgi:predicted peptidase